MTDSLDRIAQALTGRYRLGREVGAGGMATVYLAEDTKHHRQVAVKVLRPELAASMGSERFLREIEIAAGLSHPHILPLYDSGSSDGVLFYVMPFVDGPSLRDRMTREGALPIADAVRLLREIADALGYAHGRGLIHRDIKPENILLSGTHALVADFGVAKAVSDAAGAASMTATGMALGTPAYMAPEQAMAEPTLDHRVDLYALGVMAYEMLAGRGPFAATSAQQLISAHLTKTPEPVSVHRADVPPALEAVVMRCLEKDPAARWANAGEMIAALDAVLTPVGMTSPVVAGSATGATGASALRGGAGSAADAVRGAASPSATASRRRGPMIAAGVAVVALAIGGFGAMRYTQTGRSGTLIGKDVLEANDLVLVSEFENHSGDSTLSATVTDAVRADLQQSRAVKVMSQAAMWGGLKRMGLERGVALQPQKVQELAEREGAKAFVVGDIARLGAGYQLVARVVATKDGSEQLIARATAKNDAELIGALEDVGRTLRKGIGESLRSVGGTPPLAQVTTASLPALRTYTAASRAENLGERPQAIALAKEAIGLDSGFASAYSLLHVIYANMDSIAAATAAAERAYALADRLSEVGRLQAQARVMSARGDRMGEENAWKRLADLGRDEVNYANMLLQQGRVAEAEVMARRGIVSSPRASTAYWNLAEALGAQQKWAAADSTAQLLTARVPESPYRFYIPLNLLLARRDFDGAEGYLEGEGARTPGVDTYRCMNNLSRGRIRTWRTCSATPDMPFVRRSEYALGDFRLTGDTAHARASYASFLAQSAAQRNPDEYAGMITLLADVGRVSEAEALLTEWRARSGPKDPGYRADSAKAVGAIAVAKGQWARALAAFTAWRESPTAGSGTAYNRGLPEAAAIYRREQQPDSAIALFERALAMPSLAARLGYETTWYPEALVALGELHEAKGHKDKAVDYYRTYLNLMKDADAPIAAQVASVRERVFTLTGESAAKR